MRTKSAKSSLSGPAAKRAKLEKKKMADKVNKAIIRKKGNSRESGDSRRDFKSGRGPKSMDRSTKMGFKGASKVHRKR